MTDFETLNQLLHSTEVVFLWFSLMTTITFAYVTAAFFFLYRMPWLIKLMAYVFLLFSVVFIAGNLVGIYFHVLAINDQIDLLAAHEGASSLLRATSEGQNRMTTAVGFWSLLAVMIGVLFMTFWMTFFWKPKPSET